MGATKIDKSNRHYKERKEEEKKTLLNKVKKKTEMKRQDIIENIKGFYKKKKVEKRAKKILKEPFS